MSLELVKTPIAEELIVPIANVEIELETLCRRHLIVRLPKAVTLNELGNESRIWQRVQGGSRALRRLDRLTLIQANEEWIVEALVTGATARGATVALFKKIDGSPRASVLFSNEDYSVEFQSGSYVVVRKADGVVCSHGLANEEIAMKHLWSLYPQREAAPA